jgi:hypothetical protein
MLREHARETLHEPDQMGVRLAVRHGRCRPRLLGAKKLLRRSRAKVLQVASFDNAGGAPPADGGSTMKSFAVEAYFPEVKPAHCAFQSVVVKASNPACAANRALCELRKRPGVIGKHITVVKLTISEVRGVASREQ